MNSTSLVLFCLSSLALALTPGPTMLLALSNGITVGRRVAAFGIAGATLASALLITAVALGLGALLAASQWGFELLRVAGVVYLCWLGYKLWRSRPAGLDQAMADAATQGSVPPSPRRAFVRSAMVALTNPKTVVFFSAFFPQFVDPLQAQAGQYLLLGLIFVSIDVIVMLAYATAGVQAVKALSARGLQWIHRGCGLTMFVLAAALAAFRRGNA
jgi:threonine/homoserine/homoserine lactone efflux protein